MSSVTLRREEVGGALPRGPERGGVMGKKGKLAELEGEEGVGVQTEQASH